MRAAVVGNLSVLGISPLAWFILASRVDSVAKLTISGIFILGLYTSFTKSFFTLTLNLLKSAGTGTNL